MFRLNLKIALRNLWKHKLVTAINIGGLSVALAAFLLITLYVGYETSYDASVPGRERVFQVCRSLPDSKTPYTPAALGQLLKRSLPDIEATGTVKKGGFDFAVTKEDRTYFTTDYTLIDYEGARLFDLKPQGGLKEPENDQTGQFYLSDAAFQLLFPKKRDNAPELVVLGSKSAGFTAPVAGAAHANPHSVLQYDALSVQKQLGSGEGFDSNNYFTYVRVKPGTNKSVLEAEITKLYRSALIGAGADAGSSEVKTAAIILDPLNNLHLKPAYGSDAPYKTVVALLALGMLILVIACINFTNLSIAQAAGRAREVGIRKVMGAARRRLAQQFIAEIFLQCLLAAALGLVMAELLIPRFNSVFQVPLTIRPFENGLLWKFPLIIIFISLAAGAYPAVVLSGFRPAAVLKGNFQTSAETTWLRKGLLVFQFTAAAVFIASLLIVSAQLRYMRTEDKGFRAEQVLAVTNMRIYSDPKKFEPARAQLLGIPGVRNATVATDIPDGSKTGTARYTISGKEIMTGFVNVDFDYFETLSIPIVSGRSFSPAFKTDTADAAILNERAVARFGLTDPVGKLIRGCDKTYRIVGVAKDAKAQGFAQAVEPTIYTMKNTCANPKVRILIKVEASEMLSAIAALRKRWPEINKGDGEFFRYRFLDEIYGRLFHKEEQLQQVFTAAAVLTVLIAMMGLFAYARYLIGSRNKEIAVRKVLGAGSFQLLQLFNAGFLKLVLLANLLAWPLAYLFMQAWLGGFAYRISIPLFPFLAACMLTVFLTLITVSAQAWRAMKASPAGTLKYE
ncbi:hypothetical protein C7T94_13365 [Pedobacter yulinensis]|uniref:Uncharacterized protein n=1 Tax=Pedobacter yulinensis TaxID=2126353 RepID=A0A2T3HM70_9SPHI|nr:FtsX-like permease family protein [Pedobacter yulinensis]PST83535.1 hypothetical protein C7T94_13365 [Pedobacter yulinensis]